MPQVSASPVQTDPSQQPAPTPSRSGLARKGLPIFIATLISRPLGFIREAVQAALFGASRLTDVFVVAYNVPEMIQTLFFSGVLSNFFVPVITRYREQRDELSRVFSIALNGALVLALVLAGVCYLAAPGIMTLAAPGLTGADRELAIFLFRLMLPMLVLHCVLAVLKGVLNSVDHYAMPEYAGIFFNFAVIGCALALAPQYGIVSLAWGVVIGSIIQVVVQIPALRSNGLRYQPSCGFMHPAMREVQGLVLGAIVATAVVPINAFIARSMASSLPEGSISALAYAFRVFMLPVSLFAVPVYTVLLTDLSAAQHEGAWQRFKEQATSGLSLLFAVALPATAVLIALAVPIVRVLYERGRFSSEDVMLTSQALMAYGTGTLAYGTSQVMVRLFNAQKDTRTPAWVGVGSIALSAAGNWFFMQQWGHWGIALVTSLVSYVNTLVLYAIFRHRHGPLDERELGRRFLSHFFLAAVLGVTLFVASRPLALSPDSLMMPLRLLQFAAVLTVGVTGYLVLGYVCRVEEVRTLMRKLKIKN
ncbi:MAG: murein biosynthesis integral membrane protein MurJ [Deltaproteobacteria bacterium]|nr:murein biosynthesis integral membrane protein MurJ [Deltaproteobacteria bacterium]